MRYALLIAALAAASLVSPASATIWIAGDSGGQIGAYLKRIEAMRRSGEQVVIDGPYCPGGRAARRDPAEPAPAQRAPAGSRGAPARRHLRIARRPCGRGDRLRADRTRAVESQIPPRTPPASAARGQ